MRADEKHVRILVLIFVSLASLFLAIFSVYLTDILGFAFVSPVKSFFVLFCGLIGFAAGAVVFWRVAGLLTLEEVES